MGCDVSALDFSLSHFPLLTSSLFYKREENGNRMYKQKGGSHCRDYCNKG